MRKSSKMLSLVIALIFLFSAVTPAFAATASRQERAGDTLYGLGVIEGYPDGSLGLERTITRAEMTVVLSRIAGLGSAADVMQSVPSKFSDVATNAWFTGFINLASQQNWVAGYPDGTFKPNANVTYAEALTMILNVLGYGKGELVGAWPSNYIAKAAQLGINSGITGFAANAPAVRGDVFSFAYEALDEFIVNWSKDKEAFEETSSKLIASLATPVPNFNGFIDAKELIGSYGGPKLGDKFSAWSFLGLSDVDAYTKDGKIVAAFTTDEYETAFESIESDGLTVAGTRLEYADNKYRAFASNARVIENGSILTNVYDVATGDDLQDVKYVLDENNVVTFLSYTNYDGFSGRHGLVKSVSVQEANERVVIEFKGKSRVTLTYDEDKDYYFFGAASDWSEIQENDVIYYTDPADPSDEVGVYVVRDSVAGTASAAQTGSITIAGSKYDFNTGVTFTSKDNGATYNTSSAPQDFIGASVVAYLGGKGEVYAIRGSVDAVADRYGIVVATNPKASSFQPRAKIELFATSADDTVVYEYYKDENYAWPGLATGDFIKYGLDENGRIRTITELVYSSTSGTTTLTKSTGRISDGTLTVFGNSSTVVVSDTASGYSVESFASYIDMESTSNVSKIVYEVVGGVNTAKFIVYSGAVSSASTDYAVYTSYSIINTDGDVQISYLTKSGVVSKVYDGKTASDVPSPGGTIFKYTTTGEKIATITKVAGTTGTVSEVRTINGVDHLDIAGSLLAFDADTFVVDARTTTSVKTASIGNINVGMNVRYVMNDDGDALAVVVIY